MVLFSLRWRHGRRSCGRWGQGRRQRVGPSDDRPPAVQQPFLVPMILRYLLFLPDILGSFAHCRADCKNAEENDSPQSLHFPGWILFTMCEDTIQNVFKRYRPWNSKIKKSKKFTKKKTKICIFQNIFKKQLLFLKILGTLFFRSFFEHFFILWKIQGVFLSFLDFWVSWPVAFKDKWT